MRIDVSVVRQYYSFFTLVSGSFSITALNSEFSGGDFVDIIPSRRQKLDKKQSSNDEESSDKELDESSKLFTCPVDGCIKTYQRYSSLEYHVEYGNCKLKNERQSLMDKAKVLYTEKLLHGASKQAALKSTDKPAVNNENTVQQGWALKTTKSNTRFNEKQKLYLNEKFDIGILL